VRSVARFLALPAADRRLLVEAFVTLVLVRVGLRLVAIDRLRAWAQRMKAGGDPVDRTAWAVHMAAQRLPGTTCLGSALALQRLLSSNGHPSELHIGVARQAGAFAAHAWLVCDGRTLIGEDEQEGFTQLLAWRAGGGGGQGPGGTGPA